MSRRSVPMFVLAAALALPLAAFAQPMGPGGPGGRGGRGGPGGGPGMFHGFVIPPEVAQKAGVPQATQDKIRQLVFDANEKVITLRADLQRAQLELRRLMTSDNPDERAVMSQVDKVTRAEAEVRKNRIGLMLRIRSTLGPELWQKVRAEMPQHRRGFGHRRGGFGPPGGPGQPMPPPPPGANGQ